MIWKNDISASLKPRAYFTDNYGNAIKTEEVLFFDCETAPKYEKLIDAPDEFQALWAGKADTLRKFSNQYTEDMSDEEIYIEGAGLFAEYNKIVCISLGVKDVSGKINTVSFVGDHVEEEQREHWIIKNTFAFIAKKMKTCKFISGANTDGFDIPILLKKGFKYGYHIDPKFFIHGQKPWTSNNKDVQKEWKGFGVLRDARLETMCYFMGIQSPKSEMSGKDVARYAREGRFEEIAEYCEKDVIATISLFEKLQNLQMFI